MDIVCTLNDEAKDAIKKVLNSKTRSAVTLKCSLKTKECSVDEELDDVKPDELVDEAELAGCHRLVIYRVGWYIPEDPHGKIVPKTILVWFNPAELSDPKITRMYGPTQQEIATKVFKDEFMRTDLQINNSDDFTEKWLNALHYTSETLEKN